jgi:hypothetical protein
MDIRSKLSEIIQKLNTTVQNVNTTRDFVNNFMKLRIYSEFLTKDENGFLILSKIPLNHHITCSIYILQNNQKLFYGDFEESDLIYDPETLRLRFKNSLDVVVETDTDEYIYRVQYLTIQD